MEKKMFLYVCKEITPSLHQCLFIVLLACKFATDWYQSSPFPVQQWAHTAGVDIELSAHLNDIMAVCVCVFIALVCT